MPEKVKVIYIRSLSYTGTTWLNTVLGCHELAMALGPLDVRWPIFMGKETGDACYIHGSGCDFWPEFQKTYQAKENFFIALARYSGKQVFVTNNLLLNGVGRYLDHPDIDVVPLNVVRNGKALVASYLRKFPALAFHQGITEFLQPSFKNFEWETPGSLSLRYEDMMANPEAALVKIGAFVGLDYTSQALNYWDWQHHLIYGNTGMSALIRMGEGLPIDDFEGAEFYKAQFAKLTSGVAPFEDDRHLGVFTRYQLYLFDVLAGQDNARFGYERDQFVPEELDWFDARIQGLCERGLLPEF